tara:strand:- start:480 stop:2222 length:1743 start_codon:yes stop_codon:yes gene_type:complete
MLHPSTKRLIDKLGDMTRRQKVAWQEGEDGNITHDTEGYRVTLTADPHAVLLTDSQGREIETCSPTEFADEIDAEGRPYAQFVEELYREAKRHARGAEEAISAVLAGLDAVEAPAEEVIDPPVDEPVEMVEVTEDSVEDPLDDSSPLDAEDYAEMDSQSEDITFAVASLADQVNGASMVAPAGPEEAAQEDEILTDENTAVTATEVDSETTSGDEIEQMATYDNTVATDGDADATASDDAQHDAINAFSVTPEDEPAALEEIEEPTPLNEPAGGYTPTGFTTTTTEDTAPEPAEDAPVPDMMEEAAPVEAQADHAYAPAFSDDVSDAPGYAQAEPFGNFTPTSEDAPETPVFDADPAEDTTADLAPQYEKDIDAPETETEAADDPEPQPAPAPQGSFGNTGGFFGGGYGSSLGAYRTDTAPAPDRPVDSSPEAPVADVAPSEPEPIETVEAPQPSPEPMRSFSLSGITAPRDTVEPPAPVEASTPEETEPAPDVVIDGTSDLPTWLGHDTPLAEADESAEPIAEYDPPQPVTEPQHSPAPEPEFVTEAVAAPEPAAASEEEVPEAETPAPRPVKRFNPWN